MKKKLLIRAVYALKDKSDRQYEHIRNNAQGIAEINHTLKLHGEGHMANDLTPQFRELCKKVEALTGDDQPSQQHIIDHRENSRKIEAWMVDWMRRVEKLEESNAVFLKSIPDIEILKVQVAGLEDKMAFEGRAQQWQNTQINTLLPKVKEFEERLNNSPFNDAVLQECVDKIGALMVCVDTLQRQMNNTSIRQNGLINEYLEQKRFLAKVQVILDRERDDRLVNSPSHKKELETLKLEADMLVKKGRPRKP